MRTWEIGMGNGFGNEDSSPQIKIVEPTVLAVMSSNPHEVYFFILFFFLSDVTPYRPGRLKPATFRAWDVGKRFYIY